MGFGENTPGRVQGYWMFADGIDEKTMELIISDEYRTKWSGNTLNPYRRMSNSSIIKYFANKIKQICLIELEDNYREEVRKQFFGGDSKEYLIPVDELDLYRAKNIAYKNYLDAHPFDKKGKFNKDNNTLLYYLNYNEDITVADAYKLYRHLLKVSKEEK